MVSDEIYENHFGWALKKIEGLRNRYGLKSGGIIGRTDELMSDLFVVADDDYYQYKFIVESSHIIIDVNTKQESMKCQEKQERFIKSRMKAYMMIKQTGVME